MSIALLMLFAFSLIAGCIEVDISVPGFPDMATYFQASDNVIQLTIAYNFLGFCLTALIYGPLSEKYGRRPIMLIGNALLLIGSVGCVLAPTIELLLMARFIQGLGASASAVIVFAMIADLYQGDIRSIKIISFMNTVLTVLMAIAPTLGGFINKAIGWRGNYLLVAIICLISWISLVLFLPETKTDSSPISLQRVIADYRRLLMSQRFLSNSILPSILYGSYIAFISAAPFLYMETFGLSITVYALHQGAIIGSFVLMNLVTPYLNEKLKKIKCLVLGMNLCLIALGFLLVVSLVAPSSPYVITFFMMIFCMGFAVCYPVTFTDSLDVFPDIKGIASSAGMSLRMLLCAGCVGVTSYNYNGRPLSLFLSLLLPLIIAAVCFSVIIRESQAVREF